VTLKPRDWIEAVAYVGPDRRRFNSADYKGPRKRKADAAGTPAARLSQALRIVKSAATALDTDPAQARRALAAQAVELQARSARRSRTAAWSKPPPPSKPAWAPRCRGLPRASSWSSASTP
jgi:hypothetical protein